MGDWVLESRSCSTPAVSSAARGGAEQQYMNSCLTPQAIDVYAINQSLGRTTLEGIWAILTWMILLCRIRNSEGAG